jgi:CheY-like chemotaxis protein
VERFVSLLKFFMPTAIKHIVIADDDPDDVQLFQEVIVDTCPEIELRVANDGVELLNKIVEAPKPDLILLDLNMPVNQVKNHYCPTKDILITHRTFASKGF